MKEFNLQAALAGEPVVLRSGDKAYVLKHILNPTNKDYALIGYREYANNGKEEPLSWDVSGKYFHKYQQNADIVGMWEAPPETIKIGNFEFPKPESEPLKDGEEYYIAAPYRTKMVEDCIWRVEGFDMRCLKRGIVHKTSEAAEQHAKVLIAISQGKTSLED